MDVEQLMIWKEEEVPKLKPKREIKKESERKKLIERILLSEEEKNKYSFPLFKEELVNTIYFHNALCEKEFNESKKNIRDKIKYSVNIFNPGLPQMLLKSLSQYSKKNQEELNVSDLFVMCKSLEKALYDSEIKGNVFKKFRNENKLSFFGINQYLLSEEYLNILD